MLDLKTPVDISQDALLIHSRGRLPSKLAAAADEHLISLSYVHPSKFSRQLKNERRHLNADGKEDYMPYLNFFPPLVILLNEHVNDGWSGFRRGTANEVLLHVFICRVMIKRKWNKISLAAS